MKPFATLREAIVYWVKKPATDFFDLDQRRSRLGVLSVQLEFLGSVSAFQMEVLAL